MNMKKTTLLTFHLLALLSMVSIKVYAYDIAVENEDGVTIYYNYINGGEELEVTYAYHNLGETYKTYDYYSGNVVIPEKVSYMNKTRKVTSICGFAFDGCKGLTSVTIPRSVTAIGECAFFGCSYLTKVIVKDIAAWCNIDFLDNPLIYSHHLYSDENTEITDLVIPNSVTSIGHYAFKGCAGLTSITIPESVTSIGYGAFSNCGGLTSVTIPASVTAIADEVFEYCTGLTSVSIPASVTSIGRWAFQCCISLPSISIPESVTSIGVGAFLLCSGLTSITIPEGVTSISDDTFEGCSALTSIFIPESVTSIGMRALYMCYNLTSINIPSCVTSIDGFAFCGCRNLTSVIIPNSVTSIGMQAFEGCNQLNSIISLIEEPFEINGKSSKSRSFDVVVFNNATLYVPVGTIEKYKGTEGWKDFARIKENAPEGIATPMLIQAEDSPTYDLQGRRLAEGKPLQPGIYVKDGRKFVVKE